MSGRLELILSPLALLVWVICEVYTRGISAKEMGARFIIKFKL